MSIKSKLAIVVATLTLTTAGAQAEWMTTVEDDLFSDNKTAVMVSMISMNASIYAKCVGPDAVYLAYIEAAGDASSITQPMDAGDIVFKGDNGERFTSKTSIYRHNDKYVGFSYDDEATVADAIRDFGEADSKISVGLDLITSDEPMTVTVSARGSSKAVKQFIEACAIVAPNL
ncbi:hypothetical protein [Devosia naphthalenivorans]|uniref:hypothetical protein n=1 Tax=Devosia naphthalenivorans TaxID=2082392 RepID=UPI000D37BA3A|nr:hypothetical protein [Devosia naphthalenivorans]